MMQKMDHPGIVKMEEYFEDDNKVYVILELCKGGDLLGFMQKMGMGFREEIAADLFMQIVLAVNYVHTVHQIAHRDLKPDNILLLNKDASILKLSDFGTSRPVATNANCETIVGTPLYQAPEVNTNINALLNNNSEGSNDYDDDRYDGKIADYWSLGVILYIMILGCPPAAKPETIIKHACDKKIKWYGENVSIEAKALIYGLLTVDPTKRMTYNDIIKHEWIKQNWSLYDKYSNINTKNNDINENNNDNDDEKEIDNNISIQNKKRTRNEIETQFNNEYMDDIPKPKTKKYKTDPTFIRY